MNSSLCLCSIRKSLSFEYTKQYMQIRGQSIQRPYKGGVMKRLLSVLFCIFATTAIAQAQFTVYFPQVADGNQSDGTRWGTIIVVTNPAPLGAGNSAGTLNFMKDDGTPLIISWQNYGGQGSDITPNSPSPSIHFQLAAGQTTVFLSAGELGQSTTSLQTGFAKLDGGPFSATVIFSEFGP